MHRFTHLTSTAVVLNRDDVDTDQIIPARFLTTTERRGLGKHCFADWRYDASGGFVPAFPLNTTLGGASKVLVAGRNFGCGSSREHAPWALADFGFGAVIARSFADIFRNNALKNALLPIVLPHDGHAELLLALDAEPSLPVTIDLDRCCVAFAGERSWSFEVPAFARRCLLDGVDQLGYLLAALPEITAFERSRVAPVTTTS